jgi:hypothetical protein
MKSDPKIARGVKDAQYRVGPVSVASQLLSKSQIKVEDPRAVSLSSDLLPPQMEVKMRREMRFA